MENIEKLLDKYWNGETTLEEEKLIKKYFASGNTTDYDNIKSVFDFFEKEKNISYKGQINIPERNIVRMKFLRKIAVAASILLLIGTLWFAGKHIWSAEDKQYAAHEVKDEEKARQITEYALALVGKNYKKGEDILLKNMENAQKINIVNSFINN